ncbi:MAG: twin-arginine translocation signal domain-containing protein [Vicinamibacterales bacterium]
MSAHDTNTPEGTGIDRREFLRLSSAVAAAGALGSAACQVPPEQSIPFHDMPESLVDGLGRARYFHTVLDGTPVLVRTREGRPILVAPPGVDPSGRGLTVRHHAALMDLYDPDRARGPLSVKRNPDTVVLPLNWNAVTADLVAKTASPAPRPCCSPGPSRARPRSPPSAPSPRPPASVTSSGRHSPATPPPTRWTRAFGHARVARPALDKADVVLGLGAEFLDRPADGLERDFAVLVARRRCRSAHEPLHPARRPPSLIGANADKRLRVRDSSLAAVGAALAHELVVVKQLGPLAPMRPSPRRWRRSPSRRWRPWPVSIPRR